MCELIELLVCGLLTKSIEEIRKLVVPVLQRHRVCRASLFGSVARGDAGSESDVDLLVEFEGERSLLDLVALKMDLEEVLGKTVDVSTYNSLHPALQETVLQEMVTIL